jgi:hypothetical protein
MLSGGPEHVHLALPMLLVSSNVGVQEGKNPGVLVVG